MNSLELTKTSDYCVTFYFLDLAERAQFMSGKLILVKFKIIDPRT